METESNAFRQKIDSDPSSQISLSLWTDKEVKIRYALSPFLPLCIDANLGGGGQEWGSFMELDFTEKSGHINCPKLLVVTNLVAYIQHRVRVESDDKLDG